MEVEKLAVFVWEGWEESLAAWGVAIEVKRDRRGWKLSENKEGREGWDREKRKQSGKEGWRGGELE